MPTGYWDYREACVASSKRLSAITATVRAVGYTTSTSTHDNPAAATAFSFGSRSSHSQQWQPQHPWQGLCVVKLQQPQQPQQLQADHVPQQWQS